MIQLWMQLHLQQYREQHLIALHVTTAILQCNADDDDAINNDNAALKYAKERDKIIVRCFPERNSIFTSEISQMRCHLHCPICWFKYDGCMHSSACCFTHSDTPKRTTAEYNTTQLNTKRELHQKATIMPCWRRFIISG